MYHTLERMEMDSYVDEGLPHYISIVLRKSNLLFLKWLKNSVKYINLQHQKEIADALEEVKNELSHKDENVMKFRSSIIPNSNKG